MAAIKIILLLKSNYINDYTSFMRQFTLSQINQDHSDFKKRR